MICSDFQQKMLLSPTPKLAGDTLKEETGERIRIWSLSSMSVVKFYHVLLNTYGLGYLKN